MAPHIDSDAKAAGSKAQRTKQELLRAARLVFEDQGFFSVRVADIVERAGVAHGSFYRYFPSKIAIFRELMKGIEAQVAEAVAKSPDDEATGLVELIDLSNRRYLVHFREHARLISIGEQVAAVDHEIHNMIVERRNIHIERVSQSITRWQKRGLADSSIDPRATAAALVAMISQLAKWWLVEKVELDDDEVPTALTRIWAAAVGLERA